MIFSLATTNTDSLREIYQEVVDHAKTHRGGEALLTAVVANCDPGDPLAALIDASCLWTARDNSHVPALAIVRERIIQVLYVTPALRRRGVGSSLVRSLLTSDDPPVDAYALPGDRATKSLYESMGWKARLLTMRAE